METNYEALQSTEQNELFSALAKAQSEMVSAAKSSKNPFFKSKYADFTEVVDASRPALTKNNIAVIQKIQADKSSGVQYLETILCHSSGQWTKSVTKLSPLKEDAQSIGSYITYMKRYAYASLVGVTTNDDDDAEGAMSSYRQPTVQVAQDAKITVEQLEQLQYELDGYIDLERNILEKMNINCLADMMKSKFMASLNRIREIKEAQRKD